MRRSWGRQGARLRWGDWGCAARRSQNLLSHCSRQATDGARRRSERLALRALTGRGLNALGHRMQQRQRVSRYGSASMGVTPNLLFIYIQGEEGLDSACDTWHDIFGYTRHSLMRLHDMVAAARCMWGRVIVSHGLSAAFITCGLEGTNLVSTTDFIFKSFTAPASLCE